MESGQGESKPEAAEPSAPQARRCGIIMPISAIDSYTEAHWRDVKAILTDAIMEAGFAAELVSAAEDVGIIQKRIIENLYTNPIVVCDVSGRNPNVMFELGMRLAFDKPTVIVKDDATSYSFDTGLIEHVGYRRDLRFAEIVAFKKNLSNKIKRLADRSSEGAFSPFLASIGPLQAVDLRTENVSPTEYAVQELRELFMDSQLMMRRIMDELRDLRRDGGGATVSPDFVTDQLSNRIRAHLSQWKSLPKLERHRRADEFLQLTFPDWEFSLPVRQSIVRTAMARVGLGSD